MYLYTATLPGPRSAPGRPRARTSRSPRAVNDLLLPIVKGVGSERATEMLQLSLQTLGGSGYLQDYPIEQYLRDAKIDSLYEGTTAIQSLDFLFRKIVRDDGRRARAASTGEIEAFLDAEAGQRAAQGGARAAGAALADVQGMLAALTGYAVASAQDPASIYKVGQHSVRLLMAVGDLLVGWLLLRQAEVALHGAGRPPGRARRGRSRSTQGRSAAARFFADHRAAPAERRAGAIVGAAEPA